MPIASQILVIIAFSLFSVMFTLIIVVSLWRHAQALKFNFYPWSFINLKYWVWEMRDDGVAYLIIPTLIAWMRKQSQIERFQ